MKTYETPAGKVIQCKICPKTNHIKVEFASGGELPDELAGLYTSERAVETDINRYLDKIKDKKKPTSNKE